MVADSHTRAQELSSRAEAAEVAGDRDSARSLYRQAADLELRAVEATLPSQPRTKSILAVSAVSQLFKADALTDAEAFALKFLADTELDEFARAELRDTLQLVWEHQNLLKSRKQLSQDVVFVSLRGADIGAGRAPMGLVLDRITGVRSLLYRITEWLGGFPLRTRGFPPDAVRELCQPWVGEPQTGSYRFAVKLAEPLQPPLFPGRTVNPVEIADSLLTVVRALSPGRTSLNGALSLEQYIPDIEYREAIARLVRNIVPDGRRVREMEFVSESATGGGTATLLPESRFRIEEAIRPRTSTQETHQVEGVLRAVHLDLGWVEITKADHQRVRCKIGRNVLDDVVGPMLNRRVIARGKWGRATGPFQVGDIELDSTVADEDPTIQP